MLKSEPTTTSSLPERFIYRKTTVGEDGVEFLELSLDELEGMRLSGEWDGILRVSGVCVTGRLLPKPHPAQ